LKFISVEEMTSVKGWHSTLTAGAKIVTRLLLKKPPTSRCGHRLRKENRASWKKDLMKCSLDSCQFLKSYQK